MSIIVILKGKGKADGLVLSTSGFCRHLAYTGETGGLFRAMYEQGHQPSRGRTPKSS